MPLYKLGKLAAIRPAGLQELSVYANGPLPQPPASCDFYSGVSLPIDGNQTVGDCVMAGTAHLIAAWDKESSEHDTVPTGQTVVNEYFKLTGGQDAGLDEASTLQTWQRSGLFGHKIAAYAPVAVKDITAMHQAIAFYGGAMFGIQCPDSAQTQFANNEPWTVVPGATVEGGHCIVALGFDSQYLYCATWGGVAKVTYPFASRYLDECWAVIPNQFVEDGKGPSLDLAALKSDLASL